MSAVSAHRGGHRDGLGPTQELGLAQELGLHGIPTGSLVEFEGGGSMLSREVLGEMLAAATEHGVINGRGGAGKSRGGDCVKRARRRKEGASTARRWAQGSDGGVLEEGKQARLLCQADALKWLRVSTSSPSAHAGLHDSLVDARKSTKRGYKSSAEGGVKQRRVLVESGRREQLVSVHGDQVNHEAPPTSGSPNKRRRHKLYDHDHNPRVLRTLVDDSVITGIAGAGVLRAEDGKQMEELRLQLRLACHRATELEDQIFQSQTGAPHRELLGELQLDRGGSAVVPLLQERPNGNDRKVNLTSCTRGGAEASIKADLFKRCRTPDDAGGRRPVKQQYRASPTRTRREPLDVSFSPRKSSRTKYLKGSNSSSSVEKIEKIPRREVNMSEVVTTCYPSLSPPLTPTASLRRYLSSLRPFSADSARAAWGLADSAGGGSFAGPGTDGRRYNNADRADPFDSGQPRWPVLFVMGSSKPPPTRHPLGVYALPLFDEDLVALLAEAAGEPAENIRAMAKVLSRFDFRLLQSAVTRLCCAHASEGARASVAAHGGRGHRPQRNGAPGPATQAWGTKVKPEPPLSGPPPAAAAGTVESLQSVERQAHAAEAPLIMSEAAAGRALTGGFLSGVFGEGAVRDIVAASRPVVVFDSTETAVVETPQLPTKEGVVSTEMHTDDRCRPEDGTDRNLSQDTEDDVTVGESSGQGVEGNATIANAAREEELSPPPTAVDPRQNMLSSSSDTSSAPSETCYAPGVAPPCVGGGSPHAYSPGRAENTALGKIKAVVSEDNNNTKEHDGVLVVQLVRATAARFRVHSLAVRHRDGSSDGRTTSSSILSSSREGALHGGGFGQGLFIGGSGSGGSGWTEEEGQGKAQRLRRPASAGSDELGLPPLKLVRKDKRSGRPRRADGRLEEEDMEMEVDAFGVPRPRSTPRCLRPGYKVFPEDEWYSRGRAVGCLLAIVMCTCLYAIIRTLMQKKCLKNTLYLYMCPEIMHA